MANVCQSLSLSLSHTPLTSHLSLPSSSNYAAMDEMELPPGASADKAVNICGEIMKAKQDFMRAKVA